MNESPIYLPNAILSQHLALGDQLGEPTFRIFSQQTVVQC